MLTYMRLSSLITIVVSLITVVLPSYSYAQTTNPVAIIIESDGYVANFYEGRSLVAPGNTIRAIAVADEATTGFTYVWQLNGSRLPDTGSVATFTAPERLRFTLGVTVLNPSGAVVGTANETITTHDPEIYFYERNPLRGLTEVVLQNNQVLQGTETAIEVVPYFASPIPDQVLPRSRWLLDNVNVTDQTSGLYLLSLINEDEKANRLLQYRFQHPTIFSQATNQTLSLQF